LGNKKGDSDQNERMASMQWSLRLFGREAVQSLAADREFIGDKWWKFLMDHKKTFSTKIEHAKSPVWHEN
jgi:hypothetical protein